MNLAGGVVAWNAGAEGLFGWPEADVVGKRLPIAPESSWPHVEALLAAAARDVPIPAEVVRRQRRDGRAIDVDQSASAIRDQRGFVTGLLTIMTEAGEPPAVSSVGSARMEAVGRLAGGVAHDFNNILTAISGYAGLLAAEMPDDDPKQSDVAEIRKATERATRLTRQLLAFGRRDAQEARRLNLNEVLVDVLPMLRQLIGEHIELITNAAVGLPATFADPGRLEQVLVNLVLNARDAMPRGGRLIVATGAVTIDDEYVATHPGSHRGAHRRLLVEDTGSG